jgi:3'-phosphoadenosine 5'-phosphosulfate sulfotransferase (PAPS reductase)/FAD synthetase
VLWEEGRKSNPEEVTANGKDADMTQGLEDVQRIAQDCGSDLAFVVNHSGGKDSTRMLGFVRKKFPEIPTYAVMADTGFEHVSPISAADFARARCAEFGLELTVVRNPKRTFLEMVEQRGMFLSPQYRQCNVRSEARSDRQIHSEPTAQGNRQLHGYPVGRVPSKVSTVTARPK